MDNSFPQQGSDTQEQRRHLRGLQIFDRIADWLARLMQSMQLTEEEQKDAGIFLGEPRSK